MYASSRRINPARNEASRSRRDRGRRVVIDLVACRRALSSLVADIHSLIIAERLRLSDRPLPSCR